MRRKGVVLLVSSIAVLAAAAGATARARRATNHSGIGAPTPIPHVVVIFQETVSYDHYFGTYPNATNTGGQPFKGAGGAKIPGLYNTPGVNGQGTLLTNNPNKDGQGNQTNPRRLDPTNINDVLLCDQDHDYNDAQKGFDAGELGTLPTTLTTPTGKNPTSLPCTARAAT